MIIIQAIILGIDQGLTEFIPVSSSAHLIIIPWLFKWNNPALESLSFDVALHIGTLIALIFYFFSDWVRLIRSFLQSIIERKIGNDKDRKLDWFLVIGSILGAISGVLFQGALERTFHSEPIQVSSMVVMGII